MPPPPVEHVMNMIRFLSLSAVFAMLVAAGACSGGSDGGPIQQKFDTGIGADVDGGELADSGTFSGLTDTGSSRVDLGRTNGADVAADMAAPAPIVEEVIECVEGEEDDDDA